MFLYTTLSAEMIFPTEPTKLTTNRLGNDFIESYECNGKTYLSRLISTDPKKFLDPMFSIGGELKM